jgi:uncharacterized membrane protein
MLVIMGVLGGCKMETKEDTTATKEQQIEFLKKHEDEMTEYVKKQEFYITSENEKKHAKVEKVNFDFGSITAYERDAGGIKTGVYTIEIMGFYNEKEENSFDLLVNVNSLKEPTKILGFERY